jgi:hypothetical protein
MVFEKAICRIKFEKDISFLASRKDMEKTTRQSYASTLNQAPNQDIEDIRRLTKITEEMIKEVQNEMEKVTRRQR